MDNTELNVSLLPVKYSYLDLGRMHFCVKCHDCKILYDRRGLCEDCMITKEFKEPETVCKRHGYINCKASICDDCLDPYHKGY
jgi:hypothetical protein